MSHFNNGSSNKKQSKNLTKKSVGTEVISKLGSLNSEYEEILKSEFQKSLKNPIASKPKNQNKKGFFARVFSSKHKSANNIKNVMNEHQANQRASLNNND
jgi:hypothetical protein